jgi:anti-sigma-K factor RskA
VMAAPVAQVFEARDAETTTIDTANGGELTVATSESLGKMAVNTEGLPELTAEQVYQIWAITGDERQSVGLVEDLQKGRAMKLPGEGTQIGITIEPSGGSEQPTTDPIAVVTATE